MLSPRETYLTPARHTLAAAATVQAPHTWDTAANCWMLEAAGFDVNYITAGILSQSAVAP